MDTLRFKNVDKKRSGWGGDQAEFPQNAKEGGESARTEQGDRKKGEQNN